MWLIPIIIILHRFLTISHFSMMKPQRTTYPLCQMGQFMKKSFYIQLLRHTCLKFNQEVSWPIIVTNHITIPNNTITFETFVFNLYCDLMSWKVFIQKPMGNILTPFLRITVSTMKDVRHVPQCKTQIKDDKNKSFSLAVMLVLHSIHLSEPLC